MLYAVQRGRVTIFYGTDTASLSELTWQYLRDHRLQFDLVILDHTYGPGFARNDHLDASQFVEHVRRMREERLLSDGARIIATHISHEGNPVHPELMRYAAEHGYEVAYDGLTIQV
jgi:phosphoribosyl 1,2-cyclic phosphate phosphodiesterase